MTRTLTLLALAPLLLVVGACQFHTECDVNGRRQSYIWNDDGNNGSGETLTILDTNILPPEDLPLTLIVDTDDAPLGEDPATDALFFGHEGPAFVEMDYRWGTGPVKHSEGTLPDDCPPA